ncbi:MAG: hypothetical protein C0397_19085, partial [Odoribacter sp.]|nr:hypothetical protein [Odoribacter sp.]
MKRNQEDNTVFVLQKAIRKFKIKISDTSIKEFLLAHPYYPSLLSVCDALKKWGVEHYPLKLNLDEIRDLEMPFIAHFNNLGGELVFVEAIRNGEVKYVSQKGKSQIESFEKFSEKLSGAVVLIEPGQKSGETNFRQIRQNKILDHSLLPLGIVTLFLFFLFALFSSSNLGTHTDFIFWGLILTKSIGLTASIFLVLHEFKIHTSIGDKLCGFSSKTDCNLVLASNASRLFGWLNWADAGLVYFTGTFLYLISSTTSSLWWLAAISAISLPYPVFSIYYQSVRLKKWCPFCLLVQLVFVAEFLILFPAFQKFLFSTTELLRLITVFLLPATVWILFKAYREKSLEFEREHYSFLKLKRNPNTFLALLESNDYLDIPIDNESLVLGNPDAPVTLTAFLSFNCSPCASAFRKLKELLNNCSEVKLNAVFLVLDDEVSQQAINTLYYLNAVKGTDKALDFLEQWYSLPKQAKKQLFRETVLPDQFSVAEQVRTKNNQFFIMPQIAGTPTIFVDGYKLPEPYEYGDLEYYVEDIKQLT